MNSVQQMMQRMAVCTTHAQALARRLGVTEPGTHCFRMDMGQATVDGRLQDVMLSISVPMDTVCPEVWIYIGGKNPCISALDQHTGDPVRMEADDVVAFVARVRAAMLQPMFTSRDPYGSYDDQGYDEQGQDDDQGQDDHQGQDDQEQDDHQEQDDTSVGMPDVIPEETASETHPPSGSSDDS